MTPGSRSAAHRRLPGLLLYYCRERTSRPGEGYDLYADTINRRGRTRIVPLDYRFPGADECDRANDAAVFHPRADGEGLPCIEIDGLLVFAYLDATLGAVRVSAHLGTAAARLVRPDGTVPLQVQVQDTIVLDDSP